MNHNHINQSNTIAQFLKLIYFVFFALFVNQNLANAAQYEYDQEGKLISAKNNAGNENKYVYDEANNLVSVSLSSAAGLKLYSFSPTSGQEGENIVINGNGFNLQNNQNTVKFNGVTAAVLQSDETKMLVQIPVGATTGKITVQNNNGTVLSDTNFNVVAYGLPPNITSFSPVVVNGTDTVTLIGENLYPVANGTSIYFNGIFLKPESISNTQITFKTGYVTGSDFITVMTPFGIVKSTVKLNSLAPGTNSQQIEQSIDLNYNEPVQFSTVDSDHTTILNFSAKTGDFITIHFSTSNAQNLYAVATNNYGVVFSSKIFVINQKPGQSWHLPQIQKSGNYQIMVGQFGGTQGSFSAVLEKDKKYTNGMIIKNNVLGQTSRIIFEQNDKRVNLGLLDNISSQTPYFSLIKENDRPVFTQAIINCSFMLENTCQSDFTVEENIPYQIIFDNNSLFDYKLYLNKPIDVIVQPENINNIIQKGIEDIGQSIYFHINAKQDKSYGLKINQANNSDETVFVTFDKNKEINEIRGISDYANMVDFLPTKSATPDAVIAIKPIFGKKISAQWKIIEKDAGLLLNGQSVIKNNAEKGGYLYYKFKVENNNTYGIGIYGIGVSQITSANLIIYNSDFNVITSSICQSQSTCDININLPNGDYYLVIKPQDNVFWQNNILINEDNPNLQFALDFGQNSYITKHLIEDHFYYMSFTGQGNTDTVASWNLSLPSIYNNIITGVVVENLNTVYNFPHINLAGDYKIFTDPFNGARFNGTYSINEIPLGPHQVQGVHVYQAINIINAGNKEISLKNISVDSHDSSTINNLSFYVLSLKDELNRRTLMANFECPAIDVEAECNYPLLFQNPGNYILVGTSLTDKTTLTYTINEIRNLP